MFWKVTLMTLASGRDEAEGVTDTTDVCILILLAVQKEQNIDDVHAVC